MSAEFGYFHRLFFWSCFGKKTGKKNRIEKKMFSGELHEMYIFEITSGFLLSETMFGRVVVSEGVECKYIPL